jgi:hypothetical protein
MTVVETFFPGDQLIEGRQIRDLVELREFIDACIDATGNVALDVPMDMRLMRKVLSRSGKDVYDLEITRW